MVWSTIPFSVTTTLFRIKTHAVYGKPCRVVSPTVHQMRNTEWYDNLSFETPSRCRCCDLVGFFLPPKVKIKHLSQFITFKSAVQVELDHRIKCTWVTCSSQQELTRPRYQLEDKAQMFDATATPSPYTPQEPTMTEKIRNPKQQQRMLRMISPTKGKFKEGDAATHAANVDDNADDEPHGHQPRTRGGHDSAQLQDPNEQEERNQDVESNVFFSSVPQDDEETEHEPEADDLMTAHGSNRGSSDRAKHTRSRPGLLPNTTTTAGHGSLQNGAHRYRPSRKNLEWEDDIDPCRVGVR